MSVWSCVKDHRVLLLAGASVTLLFCLSPTAVAEEPPAKSEAATPAKAEAVPDAEKVAETVPEFKPPPGFRPRKRGDALVYCRKEAVMGSRFPAEKCYDEAGLREIERAEVEQKNMVEEIRACGRACDISL